MERACPRCGTDNPEVARFCRQCGLVLIRGADGLLGAGRLQHPEPLPVPDGYEPVQDAQDLYFHWEAAWGGEVLLGTETLALRMFNAGYPLAAVLLRVHGEDENGKVVFTAEKEIGSWPRGGEVTLEIASWEMPAPARKLVVALASADFEARA